MDLQSTSGPLPYSQEWWRVTLSSIADAVIVTDAGRRIAFMNPVAEALTGWPAEEAKNEPLEKVFRIVHDVTREPAKEIVAGEAPTRGLDNHTLLVARDGSEIYIDNSAAPIRGESGDVFGVVLVFRDASDRRKALAARQQLAAIIDSTADAIVSSDLLGRVTSWNRGAERLYGYPAEEAIGQPISMLAAPDRAGEFPILLARISRGERIEHYETIRQRKDGSLIDVSLTISPVKGGDGTIAGVSSIAREITGKKQLEVERAYLAAIVQSSDDAIVGKTLDSVVTSWNEAAERMFGFTAAEAIGRPIYLIIPSARVGEEAEILARLRRGERIEHFETVRQRKDGTLLDVSLTISPIRDAESRVIGASKIARDITEKKRAEEELRASHAALKTINRVGQTLASELDLEKVVQILTDAATTETGAAFGAFFYNVVDKSGASYMLYTLSGVPHEHFVQFPMPRATDLFGPTFRGDGIIRIADVKQDPRYGKNSPYFGMPEGHLPVTSYLAAPVVSHSGEVLGGLFFGHPDRGVFSARHEDIVGALAAQAASAMDNARLYEGMRKARGDAETANRLKDEFLATVSHELRTPLNAILGWARLLRMGKLDEDSRLRAVETIERSAKSQGQIIEDILDVSRIITGKLRLDVSPIEIGQLITESIESVRLTAEAKGVRIQTVLDTNANLVWGDAHRLQQVFWNLLSNAIKFTPKGGRVQVTLSRSNSYVEVAVSDNGKGIEPQFLPYVFDRFRQADSSTTRTFGGLGLGLAIVRHLTELHGGTAHAASPGEGLGATFTITLPIAVVRDRGRPETGRELEVPRAVEGPLPSAQELHGVKVLVVDDEADARELLSVVLERSGAELRLAASAREAFDVLKAWKPDVLLSDIGMPSEDGYELIRQVRSLSHKEGGSVPAAALTAYATPEDRLKVLTAGFQTHIAKPVEPLELTAVVAILAGKTGIAKDK